MFRCYELSVSRRKDLSFFISQCWSEGMLVWGFLIHLILERGVNSWSNFRFLFRASVWACLSTELTSLTSIFSNCGFPQSYSCPKSCCVSFCCTEKWVNWPVTGSAWPDVSHKKPETASVFAFKIRWTGPRLCAQGIYSEALPGFILLSGSLNTVNIVLCTWKCLLFLL